MNSLLKLKGKSGCKVEILNHETSFYIKKTSSSIGYNKRLEAQALKQDTFINSEIFIAPKVYNLYKGDETKLSYLEMEYVWGEKFSEFFQTCDLRDIDNLISNFITYFKTLILNCNTSTEPSNLIKSKLAEVLLKCNLNKVTTESISKLFSNLPTTSIPIGFCHGDLTLSNTLLTKDKVYLFDFLDSYIESPLIDMVKLRQDSKFYWSIFIDNTLSESKITRAIQVLNYLDIKLIEFYSTYDWYLTWYSYFEMINLLRIYPYLSSPLERGFIIKHIDGIINS